MRTLAVVCAAAALAVGVAAPALADDQTIAVPGESSSASPPSTLHAVAISETSSVATGATTGTTTVDSSVSMTGNETDGFTTGSLSADGGSTSVSDSGLSSSDVANSTDTTTSLVAAAGTGYTCVKKTTSTSHLVAYTPSHVDVSNTSWEVHYIDQRYSIDHARYVSGAYTTQFEQCVIGGSRNKHSYQRLANTEGEVSIDNSYNRLLGWKWGTAVDQGAVSSSINFSVGVSKSTSISGSLPVTTGGKEAGSVGKGLCGSAGGPVAGNQVNGAWNFTYPGFGTNDFKGNVQHALYEFAQPNKQSFHSYFQACYQARY